VNLDLFRQSRNLDSLVSGQVLIQAYPLVQNKPNGQFHLSHTSEAIKDFMHELPIRKIPGIGRVSERLLDSIGVKVRWSRLIVQVISLMQPVLCILDMWRHLRVSRCAIVA
jgi:hypothetical protein